VHRERFVSCVAFVDDPPIEEVHAAVSVSGISLIVSDHTYRRTLLVQLAEEVRRVDYFRLRDRYASEEDGCPTRWTDNPGAITSVKVGGRLKRIAHYYGCQYEMESRRGVYPEHLTAFESRVDEIVGVAEWIGSEKERARTATQR